MSVIRCAVTRSAVGKLHVQDRKVLERIWAREFQSGISASLGYAKSEQQANDAVHRAMTVMAQHRRKVAQLQQEKMDKILNDARAFRNAKGERDIGEFALQLVNHVHFRAQSLFRMDLAELSSMLHEFRKSWHAGNRKNYSRMILIIRELFGEDTGDAAAKAFAQSWANLTSRKVDQFNSVGGHIGARKDWRVPQSHDALAIARAGLDEWKAYVLARIDRTKMENPLTGKAFTDQELDEALTEMYQSVTWQAHREEPTLGGTHGTATWRRHADARFLIFKDADSWLEYSKKFGAGMNPFEVMMGYLRSINHDIAQMDLLGPHPGGTIRWLAGDADNVGGHILYQGQLHQLGQPSLFPDTDDLGNKWGPKGRQQYARDKAIGTQRAWRYLTGEARRPLNENFALIEGSVTNLLYAKMLAFTPFLVGGDIINQAVTRAFNSVSVVGMMRDLFDAFRLSTDRETLAQLGIEIDVGLSTMVSEARDAASVMGHPATAWVADRALTFSGLKPMTMGLRAMWTLGILHEVTGHLSKGFDDLPRGFRELLQKHGIERDGWAIIQQATPRSYKGVNVVTPSDIARVNSYSVGVQTRPGQSAGEEIAIRLMTLIQEEGEAATISGTPRSARIFQYTPGTYTGFFMGSISRLKTYSISHFQHHAARAAQVFHRHGGLRGMGVPAAMGYYAALILPSMVLVAAGTAIANMLQGKQPPDVTDPEFVNEVFWKTVSLGFMNDFIRGATDADSPFQALGQGLGPTAGALSDGLTLGAYTLAEVHDLITGGEDTARTGKQAIRFARNWVPRHWATDLAAERFVWDNLQRAVDPEAESDFRRRARRVDQGYWSDPGSGSIDFGNIDLETLDLGDSDGDYGQ